METDQVRLKLRRPHPGEYLREDILPALGMSVTGLAAHLGVTRATMSDLLHEKRAVSLDMALRLGKALGNSPEFWLGLQMHHDLWLATQKAAPSVKPLKWKPDRAA